MEERGIDPRAFHISVRRVWKLEGYVEIDKVNDADRRLLQAARLTRSAPYPPSAVA